MTIYEEKLELKKRQISEGNKEPGSILGKQVRMSTLSAH